MFLIRNFRALLILALLAPTIQADYQSGLDAYNAARYTTALDNWKAVTEQPAGEVNPAIYAETHYAIGMLYWMGQGVAIDYIEASKWLHKAAELGNAGAQGKLGFMYTEGITVEKDYDLAFQWFSKAAKQGDVDGQYNLGIFYLNGWGTEQDRTLAAQYLAAASAQGDADAEAALQGLLPALTSDEKSKVGPGSSPGRQSDRHSGLDPEEGETGKKVRPGPGREAGLGHRSRDWPGPYLLFVHPGIQLVPAHRHLLHKPRLVRQADGQLQSLVSLPRLHR